MTERQYLWHDEMLTAPELYTKGVEDEHQRAGQYRRETLEGIAKELRSLIFTSRAEPSGREEAERTQKDQTFWPTFIRAAEHVVWDPTGAPTGAGSAHLQPAAYWEGTISETWVTESMPVTRYARLIESAPGEPIPMLPMMATQPTAGNQPGEKQAVYSKAWDVQPDPGTQIDSSLYLNVSDVVAEMGFGPLTNTIMKCAAAAEASAQISRAVEAAATAGGMAHFTGRYVPQVVVVPPALLDSVKVADYAAAGLEVVLDPAITAVLIVDRNAILCWLRQGRMEQAEPSTYGTGIAYRVYGKLVVDPAGVSSVAGP